jgi:oxygen-independent coproporphyrinogen-3 oxidase
LPNLFNAQKLIPEAQLPASAVKLEILRGTIERLTAEGYVYIGMDHFALAGDELTKAQARGELQRNFQGYSTHAHCDLIALGMTAIGHVGHSYSQNAKDIKTYEQLLAGGQLPIQKGLVMTADDRLRGAVIQEIMCQGQLDFARIEQSFGIDFKDYFADELEDLPPLAADGLLHLTGDGFTVSNRGRLLLRAIAMVFDRYLHEDRVKKTFSRII